MIEGALTRTDLAARCVKTLINLAWVAMAVSVLIGFAAQVFPTARWLQQPRGRWMSASAILVLMLASNVLIDVVAMRFVGK